MTKKEKIKYYGKVEFGEGYLHNEDGSFVKKDFKCPFCGKDKQSLTIVCPCEVKEAGNDEFWK